MRCTLILPAQSILVDYQSKRVSAINILEDTISPVFPFIFSISIVVFLEKNGQDDEVDIFLRIFLNDIELNNVKINVFFQPGTKSLKNITNVPAVIIQSVGNLSFKVMDANNTILSSYSITISSTQAQAVQVEAPPQAPLQ